jgi:fatty acid desaturase
MRMHELSQPSLARWLWAATADWLVVLATTALTMYLDSPWAWPAALLVIGNRQHALSILGHDGGHRLVSRRKWLNDALTNLLCFWPLGVGIHGYRKFHFSHHRLTGTVADPELELKRLATPLYDLPATRGRMVRQFCKDLLGGGLREIIDLVQHVRPLTAGDRLGPLLWWMMVGGLCVALGWWLAVLLWFGAMLSAYWATFRLRIWIEHIGTSDTHRVHAAWWQRLLFAPHNTWYHYEHHRWPAVPCSRLPALRRLDPEVPVLPLQELFARYAQQAPVGSEQLGTTFSEQPVETLARPAEIFANF